MKKRLLLSLAAFALTGCEDKPKTWYVTTDYTIVNQIESDIVVELKFGDREVITIEPGDTQMFHTEVRRHEEGVAYSMVPEMVNAEMKIGEKVMPRYIWWHEYWDFEYHAKAHNYSIQTLTVTDELLFFLSDFFPTGGEWPADRPVGPEWLVQEMENIGNLHQPHPEGGLLYPSVYAGKYDGHYYIKLVDRASLGGERSYFTLWGESVEPDSELHGALEEMRFPITRFEKYYPHSLQE